MGPRQFLVPTEDEPLDFTPLNGTLRVRCRECRASQELEPCSRVLLRHEAGQAVPQPGVVVHVPDRNARVRGVPDLGRAPASSRVQALNTRSFDAPPQSKH